MSKPWAHISVIMGPRGTKFNERLGPGGPKLNERLGPGAPFNGPIFYDIGLTVVSTLQVCLCYSRGW